MKELVAFVICVIWSTKYINGITLIDIPKEYIRDIDTRARLYKKYNVKPFKPLRPRHRQIARRQGQDIDQHDVKETTLKEKIGFLIDQTINDAHKEFDSIQPLKARYNETAEYRIGFLMYMVKRSRDVMNELFNVAVNHKEDWKALDQLKIFELIIHTNVDTTNLLRQLLEIAVQSASSTEGGRIKKLRVALL